jgi:signal transduction histidine kinase
MEHGGSDVTVTVGDMPDGFYVADDGPGISADVRSEIFNNRESDNNESPGLGVMIVQEIAKGHSWDIDITESEAGGARFEITNVEPVN